MRFRNTTTHYGLVSKLLHWTIAGIIIGLVWLGWVMVDLSYFDPWYNKSLASHKSFGLLVLAFALILFVWKIISSSPDPAASIAVWQRRAAKIMHAMLLFMMLAIPVTGYLISTSAGKPISFFDWFNVPALVDKNESLRDWAILIHFYFAYAVGVLVLGHAGAAIKHQLIDRDGTLARMIWR